MSVPVLPAPQTFGSQFGAGLGAGLADSLPEMLNEFITHKRTQREQAKVKGIFEELGPDASMQNKMSKLFTSGLSPETQKQGLELLRQQGATSFADKIRSGKDPSIADIIEGTSLGYIPPGLGQELARPLLRDPMEQQLLQQFFGGEGQPGREREDIFLDSEERVTESPRGKVSIDTEEAITRPPPREPIRDTSARKQLLQRMMATKGPLANLAKTELASMEKEEERQFQQQEKQEKRSFEEEKRKNILREKTEDRDEKRAYDQLIREDEATTKLEEQKSKRDFERVKPILARADERAEEIIPKEMALSSMVNAIEEGNLGFFSKNKLADLTGIEWFRTAKGAQFISSGKEFFLGSLKRAGARPNQWIEQQIQKMLPQIGRSKEANLTVAEALKSDIAIEKTYQDILNRLMKEDEEKFGWVKGDVGHRAQKELTKFANAEQERLEQKLRVIQSGAKTTPKEKVEKEFTINKLPSASAHSGKVIEDDKGNRYKSTGKNWRKL